MKARPPLPTDPHLLDALYRISSILGSTDDPHQALQLILEGILEYTHGTSASIALINPDTQELDIEASCGLPPDTQHLHLPLRHGITGWVALHGTPLLIPDTSKDPRYVPIQDNILSEIAAPLIINGSTVGVINVDSTRLHAFDDQTLQALTQLTSETARVIAHLWLLRQHTTVNTRLRALINIGGKIVTTREPRELLQNIAEETRKLTSSPLCAIYLLDETRQSLQLHALASALPPTKTHNETLDPRDTAMGTAIARCKQIEIHQLAQTEEHHLLPHTHPHQLASLLTTPLIIDNQAIGTLNTYTAQPHRFSNDEKRILAAMAGLASVAIHNAQLYTCVFDTQEALRKNERLTTLGLLAAEIAHEIRNPLTVIKLLYQSLDIEFPEGDPRARDTRVIGEKLLQLEEIVERVLNFGKTHETLHARWNLAELLEETLHLLRLKLEQHQIHVHYTPPPSPLWVEVHKGQLHQALLNLLLNATQAMPQGGTITLTTTSTAQPSPRAHITLTDTGPGIPPHILRRLFDSFLTGKAEGSGLGLSIVKRIMQAHKGDICVLDTGPHGTTFQLHLPLAS